MTPERLEIARRLAACTRWHWLDGMAEALPVRAGDVCPACKGAGGSGDIGTLGGWHLCRTGTGDFDACKVCEDGVRRLGRYRAGDIVPPGVVPDLDDELTRIGVLAVVRRAHKDTSCGLVKAGDEWVVTMAYIALSDGDARMAILRRGPTGEAALLAALEAAP